MPHTVRGSLHGFTQVLQARSLCVYNIVSFSLTNNISTVQYFQDIHQNFNFQCTLNTRSQIRKDKWNENLPI